MGLAITAYSNIDFTRRYQPPEGADEDGKPEHYSPWVHLYINPDFPERAPGLVTGYYWAAKSETFMFRAGGYSHYWRWRDRLKIYAETLWTPTEALARGRPYPFHELINFSDCEGTLGPEVCAVLARDFAQFAPGPSNWLSTFSLAANTGCVCFH